MVTLIIGRGKEKISKTKHLRRVVKNPVFPTSFLGNKQQYSRFDNALHLLWLMSARQANQIEKPETSHRVADDHREEFLAGHMTH